MSTGRLLEPTRVQRLEANGQSWLMSGIARRRTDTATLDEVLLKLHDMGMLQTLQDIYLALELP